VWGLAPGVQTHGQVGGSGLKDASYLVERGDGQMMQVSELLHLVLRAAESAGPATQLAPVVSAASGRGLSPEILEHLARTKLEPMGLLRDTTAVQVAKSEAHKANPLLSLRLKGTLVPAVVVRPLARAFTFLYWTPVVTAALAGLVVVDVMVLRRGDPMAALNQVLTTPLFLLVFLGLLVAGALVHELGHAVGCRAGGAEPGAIGVGVYLLFPAFYTDVTQSYRLGRSGRLRTDLGGLYFNVWCLLAAGSGYLATGQPVLLMVLVFMHLEMVQQLVPAVRFDGYFVLADLAGVPDLFARVRPVISSLRPGRPPDPRVAELRPAARRIITLWVLLVVPALVVGLGWFVWNLPTMVESTLSAIEVQTQYVRAGWLAGDAASTAFAALSILLLAVPIIGLAAILPRLVMSPFRWWASRRARREARVARPIAVAVGVARTDPTKERSGGEIAVRSAPAQENVDDYHWIVSRIDRYYDLILIDTLAGILDRTDPGVGAERRVTAPTLDWLDQHGYHDLAAAGVVVNMAARRGGMPPGLPDAQVV